MGADPLHWEPKKPLKSLKVGVLQKDFDRLQGDQKKIYDQALADLKSAGVVMTPVEYQEELTGVRFLLEAEGAAAFDDITRDGKVRTPKGQGPGDWPNTFRSSRLVPAEIYSSWPLEHEEGLHGAHLGKAHTTSGAKADTLDRFLAAENVPRVAFIKLDVDGNEIDAFHR